MSRQVKCPLMGGIQCMGRACALAARAASWDGSAFWVCSLANAGPSAYDAAPAVVDRQGGGRASQTPGVGTD